MNFGWLKGHAKAILFLFAVFSILIGNVFGQNDRSLYTNPDTGHIFNNQNSVYTERFINNYQMNQSFMQMVMDDMLQKEGRRKIKAGIANTKFVYSNKDSVLNTIVPDNANTAEKSQITAANRISLTNFNNVLKKIGFAPNDLADAKAAAFSMAYFALNNEDPGQKRLLWIRNEFKREMLKNLFFQGSPDFWRQREYEKLAVTAMTAVGARNKSEEAGLNNDRKTIYVRLAEKLGGEILSSLWVEPSNAIMLTPGGFADRGQATVESGSGGTTFKRSRDSRSVRNYGNSTSSMINQKGEEYWADLLKDFNKTVGKLKLNNNDIADGATASLAVLYVILNDGKPLSEEQINGVRKDMRIDVIGDANIQRLDDEAKQEMYDSIALSAMDIFQDYQNNVNDLRRAKTEGESGPLRDSLIGNYNYLAKIIKSRALTLIDNNIITPRKLSDYTITADGFRKR